MRPFAGYIRRGVRSIYQRIILFRPFAALDFQHFLFDLFQGGDEAVEFGFAFALGRLNHQRTGNGEGNRRRVEAVVHQAFGDVGFGDAAFGFKRTQIDDTFVRDAAVFACIQDRIVFAQTFGDVVGIEQCPACRLLHALFAHHGQVHPSNRQDGRRTEGRSSHGSLIGTGAVGVGQSVSRCKRGKVGFQTDRADARTAAAVRDTEGFVQVHVQHVRTDFGRLHDADLGVEVGAVHVNLSAVFVNNAADVADAFFVHAVGGRIGNHDGGQSVAVLLGFGFQIVNVDVAVFVGIDNDDFQAQHGRSRRVGTVG